MQRPCGILDRPVVMYSIIYPNIDFVISYTFSSPSLHPRQNAQAQCNKLKHHVRTQHCCSAVIIVVGIAARLSDLAARLAAFAPGGALAAGAAGAAFAAATATATAASTDFEEGWCAGDDFGCVGED